MKIAYVTSSLKQCGPNVVLKNIISNLSQSERDTAEVFFLTESKDNYFEDLDVKQSKVKTLNQLKNELYEYDIIHSSGIRPDVVCAYLKVKSKFHRKKIKITTTIHNYVFQDLYYEYGIMTSLLAGFLWCFSWLFFNKIVILSNHANQYYWFLPKTKKIIINNGITINHKNRSGFSLRSKLSIPVDAILIGSCANLTATKGLDIIIRQLNQGNNIHFVVAGEGKEKEKLIKLSHECEVQNKVHFITFQASPFDFIEQLDIFMMPSRSEGFGLTVIEAVQLKVPVITSDIPIFKELFNGMVRMFALQSPSSLITEIIYTFNNKALLSAKAFDLSQQKYTAEIMSQKYFNLYFSLKSGD